MGRIGRGREGVNPYFVAFCAATGATKENFRPFEYMAWIGNKHKEFCKKTKMGKFCHEYHREFCKFLGVEESA